MIREPVVAGRFYPKEKNRLLDSLNNYCKANRIKKKVKGCILPHAGYVFSGKTACRTLSSIHIVEHIIIMGPNHTGEGSGFSVFPKGSWKTPLGEVEVDRELAQKLIEKSQYLEEDYSAHLYEHSIEVQLPLLLYLSSKIKIVPICLGSGRLEDWKNIGKEIASVVKEFNKQVLVIASSDMSHYEPDSIARSKDKIAIEDILKLDEDALIEDIKKHDISMCGYIPVSILISYAKEIGASSVELVDYSTSADAFGDTSSVVGYAGIIIS